MLKEGTIEYADQNDALTVALANGARQPIRGYSKTIEEYENNINMAINKSRHGNADSKGDSYNEFIIANPQVAGVYFLNQLENEDAVIEPSSPDHRQHMTGQDQIVGMRRGVMRNIDGEIKRVGEPAVTINDIFNGADQLGLHVYTFYKHSSTAYEVFLDTDTNEVVRGRALTPEDIVGQKSSSGLDNSSLQEIADILVTPEVIA